MVHKGVSRKITQPIAGMTLVAVMAAVCPPPSMAQSPLSDDPAPANPTVSPKQAPQAAPPVNSKLLQTSYALGPGDQVQIDIFNVPEYSGQNGRYQVLIDGTLNLPLVGSVRVGGLTLSQAAKTISARYAQYIKRPITTVTLIQPRPLRVAIAGEVDKPGSYSIPISGDSVTGERTAEGGTTQFPTVTRAIQIAGGITKLADVRQVQVLRPRGAAPDQVLTVNLWEFIQKGDLRRDVTLRDGDTIVVPTISSVNLAEAQTLNDVNFASSAARPINVTVVGEVYRPGPQTVTGTAVVGEAGKTGQGSEGAAIPPTVTRALQVAGGIKPMADIRGIQIRRNSRSGSEQLINSNLFELLQKGDARQDVTLQDGDTIFIPTATTMNAAEETKIATTTFAPATIKVNVVGEVKNPGVVDLPPSTPLNQGVLAAGGFDNRRAKQSEVELIRLNPADGTVTRRTVPIDFKKGINEETNPTLRNQDVIVVGRSGLTVFSDNLSNVLSPITNSLGVFRIFGF